MYRLVAGPFLNNKDTQVGIIGYRTFPDATVDEQIADVADCLLMLKETGIQGPATKTSLIGHSSGAHIASMAILSEDLCDYRFDHFIALSGVFDIPRHYEFERKRGVERFSPMAAACTTRNKSGSSAPAVTLRDWKLRSPTRLLRAQPASLKRFPPCLVCHGALDTTVPVESAIQFAEALTNATEQTSTNVELVILPTGHSEVVEDIMFGGPTRDTVFKWMNTETP
jgi:acetyl esterase/lipase